MSMRFLEKILKRKRLAEVPEDGTVSESFFLRMMLPQAMKYAAPYEREEERVLKKVLSSLENLENFNTVVIGAGPLFYLNLFYHRVKSYTAIEPLSQMFIQKQFQFLVKQFKDIHIVSKRFHEVDKTNLQNGNQIFVFIFNIFSYLHDPFKDLNKLVKPGDVIVLSTWTYTDRAKKIRKKYFDYLNKGEGNIVIDGNSERALVRFERFPFKKIKHYKNHTRITGKVTDFLIIYT